ncbi:MAG: translocation/assembly module TamB domain-containing protein [Proteobacteria bacterium]|nr:translocation/assembly module TamB domain-containing protein [Pseudomonadota bacterium]
MLEQVRVIDPAGHEVLGAERVTLALDVTDSGFRRLSISSGHAEGLRLRLVETESGLPTLFDALEPAQSSPPGDAAPVFVVEARDATVPEAQISGDMLGLEDLRASVRHLRFHLRVAHELVLEVARAQASVTSPFPFALEFSKLRGGYSSAPEQGLRVAFSARRGQESVAGTLSYARPAPSAAEKLHLGLDGQGISTGTLIGLGYSWAEPFVGPIEGRLALDGPTEELRLGAQLETAGGRLDVSARFSDALGTEVRIDAPQPLRAWHLLRDAPRIEVAGVAGLSSGPEPEAPLDFSLKLEPFRYEGLALPSLAASGIVEDEGLRIGEVATQAPHLSLSGSGFVGFDGYLDFDLVSHLRDLSRDPNLRRLLPGVRGQARAAVHLELGTEPARPLRLHGTLELDRLRYGPVQADRLAIEGSLVGDPTRPELRARVRGRAIAVSGYRLGGADFALRGGPRRYRVEGSFGNRDFRSFEIRANLELSRHRVKLDAPHLALRMGRQRWRGAVRGLRIEADREIALASAHLASGSQQLEASWLLRRRKASRLDVEVRDFDLRAIEALAGRDWPLQAGRADAQVHLEGMLPSPEVRIQGKLRDASLRSLKGLQMSYALHHDGRELTLEAELDLTARGRVAVRGHASPHLEARSLVKALMQGRYEVDATLDGLHLEALRQALPKEPPARLDEAPKPPGAKLQPAPRPALPVQRALRAFKRGAIPQLAGTLGGTLHVTGREGDVSLSTDLRAASLSVAGIGPVALRTKFDLDGSKAWLEVSASDGKGLLGQLRASGSLETELLLEPDQAMRRALHQPWKLHLATTSRRLDKLPGDLLGSESSLPLRLASELRVARSNDGAIRGWLVFDGAWVAGDPSGRCESAAPTFRARATLDGEHTRLVLRGRLAEGAQVHLTATAETPVARWLSQGRLPSRPPPTHLEATANVARIKQLPAACEVGDGPLRARLTSQGLFGPNPRAQLTVDAQLELMRSETDSMCGGKPLLTQILLAGNKKRIDASATLRGCGGGPGRVTLQWPVRWRWGALPVPGETGPVEARVALEATQLRPLLIWLPEFIDAQAQATGEVAIRGLLPRPDAEGALRLHDGKVHLRGFGQRINDVTGTFELDDGIVHVRNLSGRDGEGALHAEGALDLEGLRPSGARIVVALSDFPTRYEGIPVSWLAGDLGIQATIVPGQTSARVDINSMQVRLPQEPARTLQELEAHPDVVVLGAKPKVRLLPHKLRVHADGKRGFWVRRNDFQAYVRADMHAEYDDPYLRVAGYLQFDRGEFLAFRKQFRINRGSLKFDGSTELNPEVNLRATHDPGMPGSSPVSVTVTGRLEAPNVVFTSAACEGEQGALTMLLSGRCRQSGGSEVSQQQQQSMVAGLVSGVLTLGAQSELGKLVPLISIQSTGATHKVSARFEARQLIPKFLRSIVHQAYLEGSAAIHSPDNSQQDSTGAGLDPALDMVIELYFPHNIVGRGRVAPQRRWDLDLTWEP